MFTFKHHGDLQRTSKFLNGALRAKFRSILETYAKQGVEALSAATPVDTSLTATSWDYVIKISKNGYSINWTNSNVVDGVPVAILIQYGHGTGTGGYVQPRDFINPAIKPIFDRIAEKLWEEVTRL